MASKLKCSANRLFRLVMGEFSQFLDVFYGNKFALVLTIAFCLWVIVAYFVFHIGSFW